MIVRAKRKTNFTIMSNAGLRDERLSFKARGVLAYLLSMPDNWTVSDRHLATVGPDGRHAVQAALKELETHGYLRRERHRAENGKFEWNSVIYDEPQSVSEEPEPEETMAGKPNHGTMVRFSSHGKTSHGLSSHGKPRQLISTEETKTVGRKTSSSLQDASHRDTHDDDDEWRKVTEAMHRYGVTLNGYMSEQYQEMVKEFGIDAVLLGLQNAADNGKAGRLKYVLRCVESVADGFKPNQQNGNGVQIVAMDGDL